TAVDAFVSGAQAYAQSAFGLTVPSSAVPSLRSYVVNQLQAMAASGRGAVIATDGSSPVHSLSQLAEDQGLYAIGLASGSHALPPPLHRRRAAPPRHPRRRAGPPQPPAGRRGGGGGPRLVTAHHPAGSDPPGGLPLQNPDPGPPAPHPPEKQDPRRCHGGQVP